MSVAEHELRTQWRSPSDILSLLLILGPEVVQRALAQVAGTRYVPIGFSFGWTAYSINALITIVGGKNDIVSHNLPLIDICRRAADAYIRLPCNSDQCEHRSHQR